MVHKKTHISRTNRDLTNVVILTSIFMAFLITGNLLCAKLVSIYGLTVPADVFFLPITFLMTDLLGEVYGKKMALRVVFVGIFMELSTLFFIWMGDFFPTWSHDPNLSIDTRLFQLTSRMVIASTIAFTISQIIDIYIFHKLKEITNGKHLWLRNNASTLISHIFDTLIFIGLFLYNVLPLHQLIFLAISIYGIKSFFALLDTPFIYLGKYLMLRQHKSIGLPLQ